MSLLRVWCASVCFLLCPCEGVRMVCRLGGLGGGSRVCDMGAVWLRERGCGVATVGAGRELDSTALSGTLPESIGQMMALSFM